MALGLAHTHTHTLLNRFARYLVVRPLLVSSQSSVVWLGVLHLMTTFHLAPARKETVDFSSLCKCLREHMRGFNAVCHTDFFSFSWARCAPKKLAVNLAAGNPEGEVPTANMYSTSKLRNLCRVQGLSVYKLPEGEDFPAPVQPPCTHTHTHTHHFSPSPDPHPSVQSRYGDWVGLDPVVVVQLDKKCSSLFYPKANISNSQSNLLGLNCSNSDPQTEN